MPSREVDPRRRRKDHDNDSPKTKEKDKDRPRKLQRRRDSGEREKSEASRLGRLETVSISELLNRPSKKAIMAVPEMERRSSAGESRLSAYPSFSKAHSREAVGRQDPERASFSTPTTDSDMPWKDNGAHTARPETPASADTTSSPVRASPIPSLATDQADSSGKVNSPNGVNRGTERVKRDATRRRKGVDSPLRTSSARERPDLDSGRGKTSSQHAESDLSVESDNSQPSTTKHHARFSQGQSASQDSAQADTVRKSTARAYASSTLSQSTEDSLATSVEPNRRGAQNFPPFAPGQESTLSSGFSTPTLQVHVLPSHIKTPVVDIGGMDFSPASVGMTPLYVSGQPRPPPLMMIPHDIPRVDYLLLNGGLPFLIPKTLVSLSPQHLNPPQPHQHDSLPRQSPGIAAMEASQIFGPISKRLDDFAKVLSKNGSLAVATGYRSVARRLLDRLEHVFARNISSEKCECVVCNLNPQLQLSEEEDTGVSWGEILEFVSGRRELPQWPPFSLSSESSGLGIPGTGQYVPMQKLDPDVPEEFRDHYLRQNVKTKRTVHDWLGQQPDLPSSPPQEIDDETLSFAMLTHLEPERRPLFAALMKGRSTLSSSRSPTPANGEEMKNAVLSKTATALQRLYRLASPPRDPESVIYLLNNQHLHSMLATLAVVSPGEWDILVSGRFDGFLWSGAETPWPPSASAYPSPASSRIPSRGPVPFSRNPTPSIPHHDTTPLRTIANPNSILPSRGNTPAPSTALTSAAGTPAPVQLDEETEIAALADVEREIFLGMSRLEDEFELVHRQAELLRQQLRERSAGLVMAAQVRRGAGVGEDVVGGGIGALGDASAWGGGGLQDLDDEVGWRDDGRSELAPDDSASNVSGARRRKRRGAAAPVRDRERRTPAVMLEEEDEDGSGVGRRR